MTFCTNPNCPSPQNTDKAKTCATCGSKLLIQGRYRPIKPISKKNTTYFAIDERKKVKPPCIIQEIYPSSTGPYTQEIFQNYQLLAPSPHLPKLLNHTTLENRHYFIFEYIEGTNLNQELLSTGTLTETELGQLLEQILPLLEQLHNQQLLHNNIKPQNIIRSNQPDKPYILVGFTGTLNTKTSDPIYSAPEQIQRQPIPASDLYSLGVTCLHLITGIHPLELLDSKEDNWEWQDYLRRELPKNLLIVLRSLVQRSQLGRYQLASQALQDLHPPTQNATPKNEQPEILQPKEWKCTHILKGHNNTIPSISLSPDEQTIASGSHDGTIKIWDAKNGKLIHSIEGNPYIHAVAFTPDGQTLISVGHQSCINLVNPQTGKYIKKLSQLEQDIESLAISPNGEIFATGENTGIIKLWDLKTGALYETLISPDCQPWHGVDALAFSSDGQFLVSSSEVWDLQRNKRLYNFTPEAIWAHSIAISPDCQSFAVTGDMDKTAKLLNVRTGQIIRKFKGHLKSLRALAFHPNGQIIASGSKDGRIKLWNIHTGQSIQTLSGHSKVVTNLIFCQDGKTLISASQDRKLKIWQCD
ncbi:WD40 repeat domain-containing serine/threonine-protein kinase [Ancylothrix sp. C2]|uniref:WD40 repeat domain-containing serine/threonine-protein kinase n=1 Tax=Ancylothrix sp. D3o TaxID=2953691 RepID=UPI0021BAFBFD|nr:WD40 repeat domain-containing serine/threonine-protein kinase [Ancylothrix sp. D3o]MCT7950104.1 WD40 repeat domain-containing serine/threonine-protein kinase [Ancylothrix sp. D3o]